MTTKESTTQDSTSSLLNELSKEFPKSEVKSRAGGFGKNLDYIDIPSTINRFNEVCGAGWDWSIVDYTITSNGDNRYTCTVRGDITVQLPDGGSTTRSGIGADIDKDPDKALKTADAEALKKAGHKFGVALYLWDEGKRNEISEFRDLARLPISQLQKIAVDRSGLSTQVFSKQYSTVNLKDKDQLLELLDGLTTGV